MRMTQLTDYSILLADANAISQLLDPLDKLGTAIAEANVLDREAFISPFGDGDFVEVIGLSC